MGRTEQAETFRVNFIQALRAQGVGVDDMSSFALIFEEPNFKAIFERWDSLGRELFYIKKVGFVNIHVRSDPPGFWGITKQVINDFKAIKNQLKIPCLFVLLVGNHDSSDVNGYIMEDVFSPPIINMPSEQVSAFKINERDLDQSKIIYSSVGIAEALIKVGNSKFPVEGHVN